MALTIRDDFPLGAAAGGACYCCRAGRRDVAGGGRERVIDLNVFIDMEGHLCICETCGREIAALLGFITTEERDEALAHAASMATEVERLSRERDEAVTLVNDVLRFREEHAEPEPEPVPAAAPRRTTKVRSA